MGKRLTKQDWIEQAFKHLSKNGFSSLSAVLLAESLSVSRGSFYWHFKSFPDFTKAVIQSWKVKTTDAVIAEIERLPDPKRKLQELVSLALQHPYRLDQSIRAWADCDPMVAELCRKVDAQRVDYIYQLLRNIGVSENEAAPRAKMLYWATLGRALSANAMPTDAELTSYLRVTDLLSQTE